ncbi:MAG: hypothetical protein K2J72_03925 [Oscillospiraceae bacterium]|nr:hypothetical protein [Oscillospiraceae bacterium]
MEKTKTRAIKIAAIAAGILSFVTAAALICLKLFYWGFAVSADDIAIACDISEYSNNTGDFVDVEFNVTLKNGMSLMHDTSVCMDYADDCRYEYITPRAVFRIPFDDLGSTESFGCSVDKNNNVFKNEFNFILKDTSYNYDVNEIVENYLQDA